MLPKLGSLQALLPEWQHLPRGDRLAGMTRIHVERLDHVAIDVTDMQRARAFYSGLLGLKEIPRPASFDFPGAWFETGSAVLHIVSRPKRDAEGRRHLCFWVTDLAAAAEVLQSAGFEINNDGRGTIPGVARFYTADPDGNRIEIQSAA